MRSLAGPSLTVRSASKMTVKAFDSCNPIGGVGFAFLPTARVGPRPVFTRRHANRGMQTRSVNEQNVLHGSTVEVADDRCAGVRRRRFPGRGQIGGEGIRAAQSILGSMQTRNYLQGTSSEWQILLYYSLRNLWSRALQTNWNLFTKKSTCLPSVTITVLPRNSTTLRWCAPWVSHELFSVNSFCTAIRSR
jgi:hypothetical protein